MRAGSQVPVDLAVDRASVAIVMTDPHAPDNPITYVNEAFEQITGYSRDDALGRNCRFLQGEATAEEDVDRIRRGLDSGDEFEVVLTNHKADGTPFRNQLLVVPVRDQAGEISAFFGVQRELEEGDTPEASHGARPADAETDHTLSLLRELQHRVKNHLSMIVGMIRVQAKREVTQESMRAVGRRIEALALLYEEVLGASMAGGGGDEIRVGSYLDRIAAELAGLVGRSGIKVNVDCQEITLPMDQAARLGLLLSELLTNALEHAFEGRDSGVVNVRCQRMQDGRVRLVVEDDGVGMPEDSDWPYEAPGIAAQRDRADSLEGALDTTGSRGKSGVGGSIVLALTETLGAQLDVSRGGDGTCVEVRVQPQTGRSAAAPVA
ncbi:PAS domain-containing protein [Psychromarinibacter sp. C21-152]|uniref:PAS domain-containing protein n=1 Tax=Psychromarinibacter sediminicola TaxID=3033385 RepID=A0AAE3NTW2_9RHOB|nr:PAS domain-containing protein [Psychromarinibacter sediminicola]MDF0603448.1 PAS domain-containing protein [Psychromarinibacter sediminicola]